MASEIEMKAMLIDNYKMLMLIRKDAVKDNATETIKSIDREISFIKLKLDPLELPDV